MRCFEAESIIIYLPYVAPHTKLSKHPTNVKKVCKDYEITK